MTVDEPRGLIYAGLGDANRPGPEGKNLYTGSIVAIEAATGKMKWFHQLIHHDIWDFDMLGTDFGKWKLEMTRAQYTALLKRDVDFYTKALSDAGLL